MPRKPKPVAQKIVAQQLARDDARVPAVILEIARELCLVGFERTYSETTLEISTTGKLGRLPTITLTAIRLDQPGELAEMADSIARLGVILAKEAIFIGQPRTVGDLVRAADATGHTVDLALEPAHHDDDDDDDQEGDDDQEREEQDEELRSFAEAKRAIAEGTFETLPNECEWLVFDGHTDGRELILGDGRTAPDWGHVGDGTVRREKDVWRWEMTGTASRGLVATLREGACILAEFARGDRKVEPLEPEKPKRKGRPPGSKNRPKPPPPEQTALPESGPTPLEVGTETPPEPPPSTVAPERPALTLTPGEAVLEHFEGAGGSLDPRVLPDDQAEAIGEATAKGWLRPLEAGGTVVLLRLTDAGWAELERQGGT